MNYNDRFLIGVLIILAPFNAFCEELDFRFYQVSINLNINC